MKAGAVARKLSIDKRGIVAYYLLSRYRSPNFSTTGRGTLIAPHAPAKINVRSRLIPLVWEEKGDPKYLIGTDQLGRDVLSRLIIGSRVSVIVGVLGVAISVIVGVIIGLISGFLGGRVDSILSRTVDTFMSIPFIILALAAVGFLGPSLTNLIIVLGMTGWVTFARVVRGEVLLVKNLEYVTATQALGQSGWRIALFHLLPNVAASIIVLSTLQIATVRRGLAELSGHGCTTTNDHVGRDAVRGTQPPSNLVVAVDISWCDNQPNCSWMLSDGRLAA